jgi:hypothetical protein
MMLVSLRSPLPGTTQYSPAPVSYRSFLGLWPMGTIYVLGIKSRERGPIMSGPHVSSCITVTVFLFVG